MIAVEVLDEFIDLADNTSIGIEGSSPFISRDIIPGIKVLNITAKKTPRNQRIFGFAEMLNNVDRKKEFKNVRVYFHNLLWKTGTFILRQASDDGYNFSFHTDAGEIQTQIKNRTLSGLDLGTASNDYNTSLIYPDANHVFFPVRNPDFYGDKNTDYKGYVNYYHNGQLAQNTTANHYNLVPFPYLLYVLEKTFQQLGYYGIEGAWTEEENIRRVVIYNNYDLAELSAGINQFGSTITYNKHVPAISVGAFLIDVAIFFGITYKINPVTKKVQIIRLKDFLTNPAYKDLQRKAAAKAPITPNDSDGFSFVMSPDSGDKYFEADPDWLTYIIGNGAEEIKADASTLQVLDNTDSINARTWTIPHTQQKGAGDVFALGEGKIPLRFLVFNGMQTTSDGQQYPQGHYLRPGFSLRWDGDTGIVNRCYKEYVAWKSYTEKVERDVRMDLLDLLQLDFEQKVMMDNLKFFVTDFRASVSYRNGIGTTKINLLTTKL
jgi:hypothetical protein